MLWCTGVLPSHSDDHRFHLLPLYESSPKMQNFAVQENSLPDFIAEPIKYLSVISKADASLTIQSLLDQSHNYQGTAGSEIHQLIECVRSAGAKYYSLRVSRDQNTLKLDSRTPESVSLTLDEFTFSHHAYAGRYLPFKKSIPKKGSKEFTTFYSTTATWLQEKYLKDLRALIREVFGSESAQFTLLIDTCTLPIIGKCGVQDIQKGAEIITRKLNIPAELERPGAALPFVPLHKLDDEESRDLYEFMVLLHLNSLPDYSNLHVRATSMYEILTIVADTLSQTVSLAESSFAALANVNPVVYYALASNPDCLSVQATTDSGSFLTVNLPDASWTWTVGR